MKFEISILTIGELDSKNKNTYLAYNVTQINDIIDYVNVFKHSKLCSARKTNTLFFTRYVVVQQQWFGGVDNCDAIWCNRSSIYVLIIIDIAELVNLVYSYISWL